MAALVVPATTVTASGFLATVNDALARWPDGLYRRDWPTSQPT